MTQFSFIEAGSKLLGKARALSKAIKRHRLDKASVCYIGDEVRDIAAAQSVGVKSIAVTWGFNNRSTLEKTGPSYMISEPGELLTIVSQF
jgi:phosphoglycolate phosphatase